MGLSSVATVATVAGVTRSDWQAMQVWFKANAANTTNGGKGSKLGAQRPVAAGAAAKGRSARGDLRLLQIALYLCEKNNARASARDDWRLWLHFTLNLKCPS